MGQWLPSRQDFEAQLPSITDRKELEVVCMTWNVGECKPEAPQFFRWLVEKARTAAVVVVTLQEIEMGGSSIVMGGVKDSLFKSAQVRTWSWLPYMACLPGLMHVACRCTRGH